jgi:hypothetical protein
MPMALSSAPAAKFNSNTCPSVRLRRTTTLRPAAYPTRQRTAIRLICSCWRLKSRFRCQTCALDRHNWGHKAIAAAGDCEYEPVFHPAHRRARGATSRHGPSDYVARLSYWAIPEPLVLADQFACVLDQEDQHIKGATAQMERPAILEQEALRRIPAAVKERWRPRTTMASRNGAP